MPPRKSSQIVEYTALMQRSDRIVVRGHVSGDEVHRLTGWRGPVRHVYWRHAFTPYNQRQLFRVERSRYVEAHQKGPGAFPVTVLDIRRENQCGR